MFWLIMLNNSSFFFLLFCRIVRNIVVHTNGTNTQGLVKKLSNKLLNQLCLWVSWIFELLSYDEYNKNENCCYHFTRLFFSGDKFLWSLPCSWSYVTSATMKLLYMINFSISDICELSLSLNYFIHDIGGVSSIWNEWYYSFYFFCFRENWSTVDCENSASRVSVYSFSEHQPSE